MSKSEIAEGKVKIMLRFKNYISVILSIILASTIIGCNSNTETDSSKKTTTIDDSTSKTLTVYYSNEPFYSETINHFTLTNSDIEVNALKFDNATVMDSQITTEFAAGKGPDVILLNSNDTSLDIFKMASNGAFLDLGKYISEAKNKDKYFSGLFECGVFDSKQYLMPLGFDMATLYTSEEMLEKQNIILKDEYSFEDIKNSITENIEKLKNDNDKATIYFSQISDLPQGPMIWMEMAGIKIIDLENKKISVTKDQLKYFADFAKSVNEEKNKAYNIINKNKTDFAGAFTNITFIARSDFFLSGVAYYRYHFREKIDQTYKLITIPKFDDPNSHIGQVWLYGAINSNTKNPDNAYALLEDIANFPADSSMLNNYGKYPSSINKDIVKINIDAMSNLTTKVGEKMLTKELADELSAIYDNIDQFNIRNAVVYSIVNDSLSPYLSHSKPFDDCYDDMINKLELYLME